MLIGASLAARRQRPPPRLLARVVPPVPPGHHPEPPREHWPIALAVGLGGLLLVLLALVLAPRGGSSAGAVVVAAVPPAQVVPATVPTPAAPDAPAAAPAPAARTEPRAEARFAANDRSHVRATWVARFYGAYETAARTFGVPWVLLASIHKQETAFSTSRGIYSGLNFAGCCAGPMQFNVTNGRSDGTGSTWDLVKAASSRAPRPAGIPARATAAHPSVYDDYDAMMAAGALLSRSGAGSALDAAAWRAAYDYYGHDLTGVDYADQVLARAIGWARDGFCINCAVDPGLVGAVDAAWGAPVREQLSAADRQAARAQAATAAAKRRAAAKRAAAGAR
jgi:hypothetical protein